MKYILPKLQNSQELSQAHSLFRLSAANNGVMPVSHYFEADVNLLGFTVPRVGFLVVKDPNSLLTPPYTTQLPGVVGCNLIQLGCEEFGRVYGFHDFVSLLVQKQYIQLCFHSFVHFTIRVNFRGIQIQQTWI